MNWSVFVKVFGIVLAGDTVRRWLTAIALTIVAVEPAQWSITWAPHPNNKAIVVVTRCEGGRPFQAYNRFEITAEMGSARVPRVFIPSDSTACWAGAEVMRNDGDDPTQEYSAEWNMTRVD